MALARTISEKSCEEKASGFRGLYLEITQDYCGEILLRHELKKRSSYMRDTHAPNVKHVVWAQEAKNNEHNVIISWHTAHKKRYPGIITPLKPVGLQITHKTKLFMESSLIFLNL